MASSKKLGTKDDLPAQRIVKQREMIESMRTENENLKLDLSHEVPRLAFTLRTIFHIIYNIKYAHVLGS